MVIVLALISIALEVVWLTIKIEKHGPNYPKSRISTHNRENVFEFAFQRHNGLPISEQVLKRNFGQPNILDQEMGFERIVKEEPGWLDQGNSFDKKFQKGEDFV